MAEPGVVAHVAWIARQVAGGTGEEADPWAVGGTGQTAAVDVAKQFRWVSIVDEVILVSPKGPLNIDSL
jgi:hypothetical protein